MSRATLVVQDAVDRHLRAGFAPEGLTLVHGRNVVAALTEVYVRGLADGAAQAGFAKVTNLDGCWICGAVPTVAACIFGGVCESCYGDGSPLQMGPETIPPRGLPMVRFADSGK